MAKENAKDSGKKGKQAEETAEEQPVASKTGGILRIGLVLGAVLLLEAGTIGLTMMFSGGPKVAEAQGLTPDAQAAAEKPVELLLVKDQFPNQRTGRTYIYDAEIFITVRNKDADKTKTRIADMTATLATEVAVIFRRAEPTQLREATLATLTRQIKAAVSEKIGEDAEGEPIVKDVLIRKCIEFRADG